jgi:hypothetical protein
MFDLIALPAHSEGARRFDHTLVRYRIDINANPGFPRRCI